MRCAKSPNMAMCPGYPQYEHDSLRGFGTVEMPEFDRVLGGRKQRYTTQRPGMSDFLSGLGELVFSGTISVGYVPALIIAAAIVLGYNYVCKGKLGGLAKLLGSGFGSGSSADNV